MNKPFNERAILIDKNHALESDIEDILATIVHEYDHMTSGIGDGNRHNHDNLPILLCGKGGGTLNSGRHVNVNKVPMTNMFLGILNKNNIKLNEFGDSSGIYNNI